GVKACAWEVWGDGEMGGWGDGEMGRWGDGEMGRWGDGEIEKYLVMVEDGTFFYTEPEQI
ncbi:MAG: hypothetical protein F6K24_56955, partial [Okeania sp. SIO2D1]|nr:hypothetical protein [Okeania sp. SIO2D1]